MMMKYFAKDPLAYVKLVGETLKEARAEYAINPSPANLANVKRLEGILHDEAGEARAIIKVIK